MCTALVVDDDPTQQLIISKLLKKVGINAIVANDGAEALEFLQSVSPVLVILDIIMPGMSGYEVCQRLRDNEKTEKLPVVMYSGQEKELDLKKGSKSCADAYVSKLCHPQELINTIHQLLQKKDEQACLISSPVTTSQGYKVITTQC
jgi:twitching motility two-component system response regulator PilH